MTSKKSHSEELPFLDEPEQLLSLDDLLTEIVEVPEWNMRVRVASLTGIQRDSFELSTMQNNGKSREVNLRNFRVKLVAAAVVKADFKTRVFTTAQVNDLANKNASGLQRVFIVAAKLSGLGADDVEALTKEMGEDQSAASGIA